VIGAGMAGMACARTLVQAGHSVTVFEKPAAPGGRMATRSSPFGSFDHGAQYFTVRDARFAQALQATVPGLCKPWSANAVRVLDAHGRVAEAPPAGARVALGGRARHDACRSLGRAAGASGACSWTPA
jgi:renalase